MKHLRTELLSTPRVLELKKKKEAIQRKRKIIFGILFGILFAGICALSYIPRLQVRNIKIEGNTVTDTHTILTTVQNHIEKHHWYIFSKYNIWLISQKKIQKYLGDIFPRFETVDVHRIGTDTISVSVTERTGRYLWCGSSDAHVTLDTPCFFVDDTGYVFAEAPQFSGTAFFRFFGGKEDIDIGKSFIDTERFQSLITLIKGVENLGLRPYALVLRPDGNEELYIRHPSGDVLVSPKIIFGSQNDFTVVLANITAAYNAEPLKSEFARGLPKLTSIDVRFKDKVYYTYR